MATRTLRIEGDPLLRKTSRPVKEITPRILELLEDMVETMREANGVGLAAPQVGVLRRAIVIDVGEGPIKMINPELSDFEGEQIEVEGCLSVPDFNGTVSRPDKLKVTYMDTEGQIQTMEAEGLKARALCHEVDHLNGILFIDKYIEEYKPQAPESQKGDDEA